MQLYTVIVQGRKYSYIIHFKDHADYNSEAMNIIIRTKSPIYDVLCFTKWEDGCLGSMKMLS